MSGESKTRRRTNEGNELGWIPTCICNAPHGSECQDIALMCIPESQSVQREDGNGYVPNYLGDICGRNEGFEKDEGNNTGVIPLSTN